MGGRLLYSDLILEILRRLPAKSLFRFSCVCRSWCALVSLPLFRDRLLPALLSCATVRDDKGKVSFHFSTFDSEGFLMKQFVVSRSSPTLYDNKPSFVVSTCGDLLLFTDFWNTFLCNYATQELITFPNIAHNIFFDGVELGYVASTKEFKVFADLSYFGYGYKVLTLGDNQWRPVEPPPFSDLKRRAVFVNGNIHLLSLYRSEHKIASFNLEREEWGALAGPFYYHAFHHSLKELSGYLCLLVRRFGIMDIWLLKDYEKASWVKEYSICLSTLKPKVPSDVTPLAIENDGRLLLKVDYSLQLYDPKRKHSREIHRFEELDHTMCFYVKCFSSLRHPKWA